MSTTRLCLIMGLTILLLLATTGQRNKLDREMAEASQM